jgi:hypothetical protein
MSQDGLVSIVAAYRLDDWHSVAKRDSGFSIPTISRGAFCVHWPPVQWVPRTLSLGVDWLECKMEPLTSIKYQG